MPASTEVRFGQVWRYRDTVWLTVAPVPDRPGIGCWSVLYLGAEAASVGGALALARYRLESGRAVLDVMTGLPGADRVFVDEKWERES